MCGKSVLNQSTTVARPQFAGKRRTLELLTITRSLRRRDTFTLIENEATMTLEGIYFIGQTFAAAAIIVSLIYAAMQFRVYAKGAQEARYSTAISDLQEFRKILATDADCARIYRDGLADLAKLDSVEQWRFGALMQLVTTYFAICMKFGDVVEGEDLRKAVAMTMQRPGASQWWEKARNTVDTATCKMIDAVMEDNRHRT